MTAATKVSSTVANRYATALLDLASEKKALDAVAQDLNDISVMLDNSEELRTLVRSPVINKDIKNDAVMALGKKAKLNAVTQNFLGVLIQNNRINAIEQIIEAFDAEASFRRGEMSVNVTVAQDISAKQQKALQKALSDSMGSDVAIKLKVEPSILGGMVVTVGSHMIDDSVAGKLERLEAAMNKQSNQNLTNVKEA